VATITSTPVLKACSCGPMPTPPKTAAPDIGVCTAIWLRCSSIWAANSRVGVTMSARVVPRGRPINRCSIGKRNAAVFPLPVIAQASTSRNIQTYSQRTLLAYIGVRIWVHHPVVGVGWQGSAEPAAFEPELPAAHRRFPHVAAIAFPSARHAYGVQVLYVQVLADLGVVGAALLAALLGAAGFVGVRAALRAPPATAYLVTLGLFWLLLALGLWAALGLVAGVPLDALTWLALGFVCTRDQGAACRPGAPAANATWSGAMEYNHLP